MSTQVNSAKGRIVELFRRVKNNDPINAGVVICLLKTTETDALLKDYITFADLIAGANVEADFDNYTRKTLTDAEIALPVVDNGADTVTVAVPSVVWGSAGSAAAGVNNTVLKCVLCYCTDVTAITNSNLELMTVHDVNQTTNGNNLTMNASNVIVGNN